MAEQSQASAQLLENARVSLDVCRQVARAAEEQRATGRTIHANIEAITEMIRSIQQNTRSHEQASRSVGENLDAILANARRMMRHVAEITPNVDSLQRRTASVAAEVDRYAVVLGDLHLERGDEAKARTVLRRSTRVRAAFLIETLGD